MSDVQPQITRAAPWLKNLHQWVRMCVHVCACGSLWELVCARVSVHVCVCMCVLIRLLSPCCDCAGCCQCVNKVDAYILKRDVALWRTGLGEEDYIKLKRRELAHYYPFDAVSPNATLSAVARFTPVALLLPAEPTYNTDNVKGA